MAAPERGPADPALTRSPGGAATRAAAARGGAAPPDAGRRWLLASGAALVAGCASVPAEPPPSAPVPAPSPKLGQRWRYAEINLYNRSTIAEVVAEVVEVSPRLRVSLTEAGGLRRADEIYYQPWAVLQEPSYDVVQSFESPMPVVPQRLEAGARETYSSRYRAEGASRRLWWTMSVHAVRWERLRVPAGEFVCLRVERQIAFEHFDGFRHNCERQETVWYSPQVQRWVRREWTGRYLLPGGRLVSNVREDWVRRDLLDWQPDR